MTVQISKSSMKQPENKLKAMKDDSTIRFVLGKGYLPKYVCQITRRQKTYDLTITLANRNKIFEEFLAVDQSRAITLINGYVEAAK